MEEIELPNFENEYVMNNDYVIQNVMTEEIAINRFKEKLFNGSWNEKFLDYVKKLPDEEFQKFKSMIDDQGIMGNSHKQGLFIMTHTLPFAICCFREDMAIVGSEISETVFEKIQMALGSVDFYLNTIKTYQEKISISQDRFEDKINGLLINVQEATETQKLDTENERKSTLNIVKEAEVIGIKEIKKITTEGKLALEQLVRKIEATKNIDLQIKQAELTNLVMKQLSPKIEGLVEESLTKVSNKITVKHYSIIFGVMLLADIISRMIK